MIVKVTTTFDREGFNAKIARAVNKGLSAAAVALAGKMQEGMSTNGRYASSPPGSPPNVRRGILRRSVTSTDSVNFRASAGTPMHLGWVHETGNGGRPIKAVRSKFLPVPVRDEAARLLETHGKSTRFSTGASGTGYVSSGGLRNIASPKLVPIRTKRGSLVLVKQIKGRNARTEVWFVLKRQITLHKRPWLMPALNRNKAFISGVAIETASKEFGAQLQGGIA